MKKTYLITLIIFMAFIISIQGKSQEKDDLKQKIKQIEGVVLNTGNRPIEGALIKISNDTITTMTNKQGKFSLKTVANLKYASISVIADNYRDLDVYVNSKTSLKLVMLSANDRVKPDQVYNTGYYTEEMHSSSTPLGVVSETNIGAIEQSFEQALQGKIAGVEMINRSGMPGEGADFTIRGLSSLTASNSPLVILDGVYVNMTGNNSFVFDGIYNNLFSNINPSDIEKITILKGAEAAAYGSMGANGVVIVDTKKSDGLKTTIDFSMYGGVAFTPSKLPVLKSNDFTNLMTELAHQRFDASTIARNFPGLATDENSPFYKTYNNETNWQDEVFNLGKEQNYFINVKGGDAIANYSLSLGYNDIEGIIKQTKLSRYTTHINANINVSKKVKLWTSLGYNINKRLIKEQGTLTNVSPIYSALFKAPSLHPYETDAMTGERTVYLEKVREFDVSNPTALVQVEDNFEKSYNIFASLGGRYDFTENWAIEGLASLNYFKNRENLFVPGASRRLVGSFDDLEIKNKVRHGIGTVQNSFFKASLKHDKRYQSGNKLSFSLNGNVITNKLEYDFGEGINSANDKFNSLTNTTGKKISGGTLDNFNYLSFNSIAKYSIRDKYYMSAIISTDRSSVYGSNGKFEIYPSISLAWRLSSEKFLQNATWLNDLKVRTNFGIVGNSMISSSSGQFYYTSNRFKSINGIIRSGVPNTDLTSEKRNMFDFGFDLTALNKRIQLNVDLFSETTKDLMINNPTVGFIGYDNFYVNGGELQNKGLEIALNLKLVDSRDWSVNVGGNATFMKSELKNLNGNDYLLSNVLGATIISKVGSNPYEFYGYKTKGVFSTQAEADKANLTNSAGVKFNAGDVIFVDKDNNGIIDSNDRYSIGNATPDVYGGIHVDINYKKFFVKALFTYSFGNDVYNYMRSKTEDMTGFNNQLASVKSRWKMDGQETNIPKATFGDPMGNARFSDRWIEDGSFMKLKTLTLGYTLPKKWLGFVRNGTVFVSGENLFTMFSNYLGYDPEFQYGNNPMLKGIDYGKIPLSKRIVFGVKLNL
ncbi:SusC/RagA family TonB-linked outer membrane protein [Prolixibacteraceae bacterium JC049]|nr:SusC/RagA family TonB-linked outer membrane protein [Prolixibacteraceae bacterium JC049]